MSWKKHFKIVKTVTQGNGVTSPGIVAATSKFSNWLPEVYQGPPNRLQRYVQYDQMDMDHEINAALDTIAEFSTQLDSRTGLPFSIRWKKEPSKSELSVLENVLMQWCYINEFPKRMFRLFRSTLKYGDQFFIRDPETFKLLWVSQENVEKVIVNESKGKKIEQYYIKNLDLNLTSLVASDTSKTTPAGFHSSGGFKSSPNPGQPNYTTAHNMPTGQGYVAAEQSVPIDAEHVVQVSLTEGMDNAWPFGVSVLEPIFKIYKQKELIEDSVLIYRIHRAPERRVFKIDVGTMPPHKAAQYIERVKYEVQQKRIPSKNGGGASVTDAAYNPMCLDLSTRIPLLDGRTLELNELINEYQQGKENWVYSTDPITGKIMPGNITWAGITRKDAETIKITLDNGKEIICTPDHKIPVLGKGFVEAQDLTADDPLISFETREKSLSNDKNRSYTQVFDHSDNTWKYVHRVVAEFFKDMEKHQVMIFDEKLKELDKDTVHHKDYNRYNNDPRNLAWMSFEDHKRFHVLNKKEYWENISDEEAERVKDKIRQGLEEYRKNNPNWKDCYKGHSDKIKEALSNIDPDIRKEQFAKSGKSRSEYLKNNPEAKAKFIEQGKDVLSKKRTQNQTFNFTQDMLTYVVETVKKNDSNRLETIELLNQDKNFISLMREANPVNPKSTQNVKNDVFTDSKLKIMYEKYGYKNWRDFKEKTAVYNHRISKIEKVENRDVGTITVDFQERWHKHHTFALEAGIFVKNSMLEDYYFAQTSDGRGSDVTTLPGGENMGEIDDLRYFNNKMMRALGVPSSYLPTGPEDGSASYNDGRVGTAFIQEFRFSKTCQRHQNKIVDVFDAEFKKYLKFKGHSGIDTSMFEIVFNEPQNFSKYRQIELDSARINNFTSISDVGFISKRFAVKKYLGLSEEEVKENEKLWAEENNANTAKTSADIRDVGVVPPGAEDFENMSSDLGDFDDDEFADEDIEDVDTDNVVDDNVEGEE